MSEEPSLRCELFWDKLSPGYLRYKLGPVELLHSGMMYNGQTKVLIPKGHCLVLTRRLMLRFPYCIEHDSLIDAVYPDSDEMPEYFRSILRKDIGLIRGRLALIGLRVVTMIKIGWRIEFIPEWEAL